MITIQKVANVGANKHDILEQEFYWIPFVDGKSTHCIAETEDVAMLIALGIKYQGANSQFASMACRMLQIESSWAN